MKNYTLHHGNNIDVLKQMIADGVQTDAVVTDPPYALTAVSRGGSKRTNDPKTPYGRHRLADKDECKKQAGGFMSRAWDSAVPTVEFWELVYQVLKPGGHVLSFGGCYDKETEVLTKRGWVYFPDVLEADLFASLDPQSHIVEWVNATEIVKQKHTGRMIEYRNNHVDLLVTDNHNMFVSPINENNYRLVRADAHIETVRVTKTSNGCKDASIAPFILPKQTVGVGHGHYKELPDLEIPLDVWVPFLAMYLAQGSTNICTYDRGQSFRVQLCHFVKSDVEEFTSLLSPYFSVKVYEKEGKVCIHDKRLAEYCNQFGLAHDKFIPEFVKTLDSGTLRLFLTWYMRGDGDRKGHRRIYTCSERMRDDIQEIAMYAGWASNWSVDKNNTVGHIRGREIKSSGPQYILSIIKKQTHPRLYNPITKKSRHRIISDNEWNGQEVYCVELSKNNTLYVRRNGKAVWCGNTRTYHRMVVNLEDAGFEIRDQIAWLYGCLSEDTEVLVNGGWIPYSEVKSGDTALGYDVNTKQCSWQPIQDVITYDYNDTAYRIQSGLTDQIVSRNHRCIVERNNRQMFNLAEDAALQHYISVPVVEDLIKWITRPTLATITPLLYCGVMWCIRVSTGAFVARRNGKVFVTGNSGFPKATNISKQIDRMAGVSPEVLSQGKAIKRMIPGADQDKTGSWIKDNGREFIPTVTKPTTPEAKQWEGWFTAIKPSWEPVCLAQKPFDLEPEIDPICLARKPLSEDTVAENVLKHGTGALNIDDCRIGTTKRVPGGISTHKTKDIYGKYTQETGQEDGHNPNVGRFPANVILDRDAAEQLDEQTGELKSGSGIKGKRTQVNTYGVPTQDLTTNWVGDSGGASRFFKVVDNLEPEIDPIVLARKPLSEDTVAENVRKHGTGALNIDGCRIGTGGDKTEGGCKGTNALHGGGITDRAEVDQTTGRFPANVLLNEEAAERLDEQTTNILHDAGNKRLSEITSDSLYEGGWKSTIRNPDYHASLDQGKTGASRFYYTAKASKKERRGSTHPTVKPVKLMRYLCRLITPPGGTVLDPFAGSGSTGEAAVLEGFYPIMIEMEDEYIKDIEHRMSDVEVPSAASIEMLFEDEDEN